MTEATCRQPAKTKARARTRLYHVTLLVKGHEAEPDPAVHDGADPEEG